MASHQPSDPDFVKATEKKILVASLSGLVLARMAEKNMRSVSDILSSLNQHFGFHLSPGTVYPIIYSLEKKGDIQRVSLGSRRVYVLTEQGKKSLARLQGNIDRFQSIIHEIMNK